MDRAPGQPAIKKGPACLPACLPAPLSGKAKPQSRNGHIFPTFGINDNERSASPCDGNLSAADADDAPRLERRHVRVDVHLRNASDTIDGEFYNINLEVGLPRELHLECGADAA